MANKGDGSIIEVKKKDGTCFNPKHWRIRIDFGTDPVTQERDIVSRTVSGTKAYARKIRDEIRKEHEAGIQADGEKMTFTELADMWLKEHKKDGISEVRVQRIKSILENLKSHIGNVKIRDLTRQNISALYDQIREEKLAQRGKFSESTLLMYHKVLKQCLQFAVDDDLLMRNPCAKVKPPKAEKPERKTLSNEDAKRLLKCINKAEEAALVDLTEKEKRQEAWGVSENRTSVHGILDISCIMAVRIGLATGMRRGEVLGLTWECVDFDRGVITVKQSLSSTGKIKPPKTEGSIRTISIDDVTFKHLAMWKQRQAAEVAKITVSEDGNPIPTGDEIPVCCSNNGVWINPNNFSSWWRKFRDKYKFEDVLFHELRHTQATQLLANGVDVKTVQERLGHENPLTTLNHYAHALSENDRKAASLIGTLFSSKEDEEEDAEQVVSASALKSA